MIKISGLKIEKETLLSSDTSFTVRAVIQVLVLALKKMMWMMMMMIMLRKMIFIVRVMGTS